MAFLVHALYREGTEQLRERLRPDHVRHFLRHLDQVVYGGSLRSDDGETPIGGAFVLKCATRQEVADFLEGDPYHRERVFGSVKMVRIEVKIPEPVPGALLESIGGAMTD